MAQAKGKKADNSVCLAKKLSIDSVSALIKKLKPLSTVEEEVAIDVSKVESVDTASLQVLASFANTRLENEQPLEWVKPSSVLREAAELLDMNRVLELGSEPVVEEDDDLCPVF